MMLGWICVGVVVLIALVFAAFYILSKVGSGMPVLEATAATNNGKSYFVSFRKLHPETAQVEYERMILCCASKLLYVIGSRDRPESLRFMTCIELLGNTRLTNSTDVMSTCNAGIDVSEHPVTSGKTLKAVLRFINPLTRGVQTYFPTNLFENQLVNSWLAIVQASLPKLDEIELAELQSALNRMATIYMTENVDPSSLTAMARVPNRAFLEATLLE